MHEFILIDPEDVPCVARYGLIKRPAVIERRSVTDKFIVNAYRQLSPKYAGFSAYRDKIGNKKAGLCYYRATIFMTDMLPVFLEALSLIKPCGERNRLISLCKTAVDGNLCVIHFGI